MSYWLHPKRVAGAQVHSDPPPELLPAVREFGFIPSIEKLRAGDLLLVSEVSPPLISKAIQTIQKQAGFEKKHAMWHHAAVYVGNELLCEAERNGTRIVPIYHYCKGKHALRFRRDNSLNELESCKIALEAALKLKYKYDRSAVLQLYWQSKTGWKYKKDTPRKINVNATICSQLYADAYGVVTKNTLDSSTLCVSPAHLASNKTLQDIPMTWLSIPKE